MSVPLPPSLARPWPRRQDFRRAGNYNAAVLSEILRGPLRLAARSLAGNIPPSPPETWRRGLLLGASHIGDVLYNTPSLPALRAGLPDCRWTYLVSGVSGQILDGNPNLDQVVSIPDSGFRERLARACAALSSQQFDVAVAYGGASWQDLVLALKLKIPNRVAYVHKGFSGLITHPVALHFPQPFPAYFRDLVGQLTGTTAAWPLRPLVYPQPAHEQAALAAAAKLGLDWNGPPVLACSVTSRQPTGVWPEENFYRVIAQVRRETSCAIVFTGARSDAARLQRLAERTGPGAFVLAGDLDLLSLVAFLRRCRAALTTDSGPRHLANAAGIPVVFVRNLSFRAAEAGAYCDTDHDMAPRELQLLDDAQQVSALAAIDTQAVAAEVISLLRR